MFSHGAVHCFVFGVFLSQKGRARLKQANKNPLIICLHLNELNESQAFYFGIC